MKVVLFLLSGNALKISNANKLDENNLIIIKLDEKELSKPFKMMNLINQYRGSIIFFGTIDNNFQRFQTFIKIYLFLTLSFEGGIIDEIGNKNSMSVIKLFFLELPLLFVEIVYSIFLIVYYHIKIFWLKWKYTRN